jgi:hypothetical protein
MTTSSRSPTAAPPSCWYAEATHRPSIGSCPAACHGPATFAERVAAGHQHTYCDTHAVWRRQTSRLPSMVHRLA